MGIIEYMYVYRQRVPYCAKHIIYHDYCMGVYASHRHGEARFVHAFARDNVKYPL